MSSCAAGRTLISKGRILALAVAAIPSTGSPQLESAPALTDPRQQILDLIEEEQAKNGVGSPNLIEPLTTLGLLHLEQGEPEQAAVAFAKARQVVRVNYGFSTFREAALLGHWIRAEEARGSFDTAWNLEQALLALAGQHPGELGTLPIYREFADKRLGLLDRYRFGEDIPPQISLGCYYARHVYTDSLGVADSLVSHPGTGGSCKSGSRRTVLVALLMEARSYQAQAIEALRQNGRYAGEELPNLVTEFLRSSVELEALMPGYDDPFVETVLRPVLAHEPEDSASLRSRANILVQVADFNVLRSHRARRSDDYELALKQYEQAYAQLENEGVERTSLDEIFSPELPVVLPAFEPNPLASSGERASGAYIDVAFDITRYGQSKRIQILDTTKVTGAARRELVRLIERSAFRPRAMNGRIPETSQVVVRYYPNERQD